MSNCAWPWLTLLRTKSTRLAKSLARLQHDRLRCQAEAQRDPNARRQRLGRVNIERDLRRGSKSNS